MYLQWDMTSMSSHNIFPCTTLINELSIQNGWVLNVIICKKQFNLCGNLIECCVIFVSFGCHCQSKCCREIEREKAREWVIAIDVNIKLYIYAEFKRHYRERINKYISSLTSHAARLAKYFLVNWMHDLKWFHRAKRRRKEIFANDMKNTTTSSIPEFE